MECEAFDDVNVETSAMVRCIITMMLISLCSNCLKLIDSKLWIAPEHICYSSKIINSYRILFLFNLKICLDKWPQKLPWSYLSIADYMICVGSPSC